MKSFRRNRWRVRDARGALVGLFDAPTMAGAAAGRLDIQAEEYRSIRREATRSPRVAMIAGVVAGVSGTVIPYGTLMEEGLTFKGVCMTLTGVALVGAGILSFRMRGHADPDLFSEAMLRHGRCPRCTYRVAECKPDPDDGCTVCPECGGAWRVVVDMPSRGEHDERA